MRLRADEHDARLLELIDEQVAEQKVTEVVHAHRLLEPVGRPSRLLVLYHGNDTVVWLRYHNGMIHHLQLLKDGDERYILNTLVTKCFRLFERL